MKTNKEFVEFITWVLNTKPTIYGWGMFGLKLTESLISQKKAQYPQRYTNIRVEKLKKHIGENGCDCVGLYKWFIWSNADRTAIYYNSKTDRDVSMLRAAGRNEHKGTDGVKIGACLYTDGHVGFYVGNGYVIECTLRGSYDGVVMTKINDYSWKGWFELPEIEYLEEVEESKHKTTTERGKTYSVTPNVGLWLHNSTRNWGKSTRIKCLNKGTVLLGDPTCTVKNGNYTSIPVIVDKHTVGFCAMEYLKEV